MSDYISDNDVIYTDETGTVRVRVVHDPHQGEPYFDGAMPTLRLDSSYYGDTSSVAHVYGSTDYGFDAEDVWRRLSAYRGTRATLALFKRYVRIFHGSTTFHEYNVGITNEYGYLTFDTATWWAAMGRDEVHALITTDPTALAVLRELDEHIPFGTGSPGLGFATGLDEQTVEAGLNTLIDANLTEMTTRPGGRSGWVRKDGAAESFEEYRAWIVGDCYTLVLEHKVRLHITKEDLAFPARPWEDTESDEWEETDSIGGIYGDDWGNALSSARGNFDLPETTGDAAA